MTQSDMGASIRAAVLRARADNIESGNVAPRGAQMVYLVQCTVTGLAKIGIATDPWKRLAALQTGSPTKLRLIAAGPGGREREKTIHATLSGYRSHGEWFSLPDREIAALSTELGAPPPRPGLSLSADEIFAGLAKLT